MIGLDLDNTIVCYDQIFHRAALERELIDLEFSRSKLEIRDKLRREGKEEQWTLLQGYVYGPGMREAPCFNGVLEFLTLCNEHSIELSIISHRTKYNHLGEKHDLHDSATSWLASVGILTDFPHTNIGQNIFFETSKEGKLKRIAELKCRAFVDDLPEILEDPLFPSNTREILFDPYGHHKINKPYLSISSWECLWEALKRN